MLQKKKIAILGTSPIMILLYFRLKKKNFVDVFEHLKIGGAWRLDQYQNKYFSPHNNVIVPLKKNEEKYINPINSELENFGCKIIKPKGNYQLLTHYKPQNIYIHDLSNLFIQFKKKCNSLKKKKITNVKVSLDNVYLNEKKYDHVFFPTCFDINKIIINKSIFRIKPIKSISHHLTVVYKRTNLPNISYTENFDNVFDRAYFRKNKYYIFFTGRVRRSFKKLQPWQLIKSSSRLQKTKNNIIRAKLNKYCHNIIEENILKDLKTKLNKTNMKIIETRQFVNSYKILNKFKK